MDEFELYDDQPVDSAMSNNPHRAGRFLPMIRYLSKVTITTSSVVTSSVNSTGTATYPLFYCTPSGFPSTSVCASSIAYINLVRKCETRNSNCNCLQRVCIK